MYTYNIPTTIDSGAMAIYVILALALVAFSLAVRIKIFQKAGIAGWKAIVPFYNIYLFFQMVGMPGWLVFLIFIPFIGSFIVGIAMIIAEYKLAVCFNKGVGFGIGLIFLTLIFEAILAFDKTATYKKIA